MKTISNSKSSIIRTERGLTISGTRITLYDVMDYVSSQYPPKFIGALFNLTNEQINVALAYTAVPAVMRYSSNNEQTNFLNVEDSLS